ncbi:hypothetical protein BJX64DRAFT_254704 [Aspergillus heterothallicus]
MSRSSSHTLPTSTRRQKHNWLSLVKDTVVSSTFAVSGQRCIEFQYATWKIASAPA